MNLREIRKEKGMTQSDLATICKVDQATISRYETEARGLRLRDAKNIAKALDCTVDELIGDEEPESEK